MTLKYDTIKDEIAERIINDRNNGVSNPFSCTNDSAVRRKTNFLGDNSTLLRPPYVRDIEKILHLPLYNRYSDKTQVFSLYSNDDITRRSLHVQLVSRIARNIGSVLGLNLELLEAIALGHDIGHTPFGHAGEKFLSELYNESTGRYFNHNVNSVRILDSVYCRNLTIQTLDGILCHNGEVEKQVYRPSGELDFVSFDNKVENAYIQGLKAGDSLNPSTLEGCLVRVCDMIAYLGKDRQDSVKAGIISDTDCFDKTEIGFDNADIINNLSVDIINNSYGENYIKFSKRIYDALVKVKSDNYEIIYKNQKVTNRLEDTVKPMFYDIYTKLLSDLKNSVYSSVIFTHHIDYVVENTRFYESNSYLEHRDEDIVVDYISSMTDDYFVKLYEFLFPGKKHGLIYKSYFNTEDN